MWYNPGAPSDYELGKLDPTVDDRGAKRRILLPFYPALVRGQKKAVTVAAKSGQFTAGEVGWGQ